jgi:MFS family permease
MCPIQPYLISSHAIPSHSQLTPPTASDEEYAAGNGHTTNQDAPSAPPYDTASTTSAEAAVICPPHTTERKITTKIDMHIIPFVSVLYLMAFLDRVNIANARAFGLEKDLGMTGVEYNTALTIFFIPYILCEIPSNIFLKHFSPRVWLSLCCIGFGAVTVFQGLVQTYGGLLATRFFLGLFECGMFPGCFYLLSTWYRRHEAQKRFSLFFSSTSLAGAFGGLLASAIGKMDYIRGYRGWRWIFLLEGVFTVVLGVFFLFTFPSFPEQAVCTPTPLSVRGW